MNFKANPIKYFNLFNCRRYEFDRSNNSCKLILTRQSFRTYGEKTITKNEFYTKITAGNVMNGTEIQLYRNEDTQVGKKIFMTLRSLVRRKRGRSRREKLNLRTMKIIQSQQVKNKKE